jgi:hypothetical protein
VRVLLYWKQTVYLSLLDITWEQRQEELRRQCRIANGYGKRGIPVHNDKSTNHHHAGYETIQIEYEQNGGGQNSRTHGNYDFQ